MKYRTYTYLVGDFETTVYEGQENTEVWASAIVEMYTEDAIIFHSIADTFNYLKALEGNLVVYYHNLKFDGSFWLSFLMTELQYHQATVGDENDYTNLEFKANKDMLNNTFKYSISNVGLWYSITIKQGGRIIELRDSFKLLPFSVRELGEAFKTKHRKLDMEYEGYRYAGCEITDEEKSYIANDVYVVKEALEVMFNEGHDKLTIGTCCLEEFRSKYDKYDYSAYFPNLYNIPLDENLYGSQNVGSYVRKSYKGGWCYLVKGKENIRYTNGTTADVNSLYPSVMSGESGNRYPIGSATFWKGDIPLFLQNDKTDYYYFVRIKTEFKIKKNMLPCIQIKNDLNYRANEWLETSDVINPKTGNKCNKIKRLNGEITNTYVILTLTMTDYQLIKEHYDLINCEVLDGCWFHAKVGIFDDYIEKYKKIKMESTGAIRTLAKLFLNNLYGKLSTSTDSSFKYAYVKNDGVIGFVEVKENKKKPGYIPCGSAITSYARNFTIRAAQKNYHGVLNHGFIYADTDSIHCDLPPEKITGIKVDNNAFNCWKLESCWDDSIFVRQKTYIEHINKENLKPIDEPYYNIRCAGMPTKCKELLDYSLHGLTEQDFINDEELSQEWECYNDSDKEFVTKPRTLSDFKIGIIVPGKLMPKRIKGGILLVETPYEMR